jgi:BirA family transcriptional regulator, biotin operon repressor / biotin---[acetyl-CoA-carboxylase] ligase
MNLDYLHAALPGRSIHYYETIGSTMTAATGLEFGSIVLAEEQTAGQGRHGHNWHSEPGAGIYCSIVLQPVAALTLALGLATAEAIAQTTGVACDIRWPNDLMLAGKKCAGILVQLVDGAAIAGIGINVNHTQFPPELSALATSLRLQSGREISREDLLIALLPAIDRFTQLEQSAILDLFARASSYVAGRRVSVTQPDGAGAGVIYGVTAGLDPNGFLKLHKDDGTDTLILAGGVRAVSA